jgi:hypothetical protein
MTTAQTSPTVNRGQVWRAWRHSRGIRRVAREISPRRSANSPAAGRGSSIAVRPKVAIRYRDTLERTEV